MVGFAGSLIWDMLRTYQWQFNALINVNPVGGGSAGKGRGFDA